MLHDYEIIFTCGRDLELFLFTVNYVAQVIGTVLLLLRLPNLHSNLKTIL